MHDPAPSRDPMPLVVSVLVHLAVIAFILWVRLAPVDLPGLPQPIAISMLPPETTTPGDTSRAMASGLPSASAAVAASPPAPPVPASQVQPHPQHASPPVMSAPAADATRSDDFPSAAVLQTFNPMMQSDRTDVRTMQAPPLVLDATPDDAQPPEARAPGEQATPLNGAGGVPGMGQPAPNGGQGKVAGAGTAGRGKMEYEFLIMAMDQMENESAIDSLKQYPLQLEQCGLSAVKSPDKNWLVTVRVIFDPRGNMYRATIVNPPANPSEAYQTAVDRLMIPLQTIGCNHLSLPYERPAWHTGTLYFYPQGNPSMPDQVPDGRFFLGGQPAP